MAKLLNKPQAGADNSGEFFARVSDLGAVRQRPVPLFGKCLVAVLDDNDYYLGKDCYLGKDYLVTTFAVAFLESHLSLTPAIHPFFILAGLQQIFTSFLNKSIVNNKLNLVVLNLF